MPADKPSADISKVREAMNQARNEKQKAVLLKEVVRLGAERFRRAAEETRKQCQRAQNLQSRRATRKNA